MGMTTTSIGTNTGRIPQNESELEEAIRVEARILISAEGRKMQASVISEPGMDIFAAKEGEGIRIYIDPRSKHTYSREGVVLSDEYSSFELEETDVRYRDIRERMMRVEVEQ
jgi:hypothetical protein